MPRRAARWTPSREKRGNAGALVGYLPGLARRRIADLRPGEAKTVARDAAIIAETAHTIPHPHRSIHVADQQAPDPSMHRGIDADLAGQITQVSNRIRGLLTQIHPALERMIKRSSPSPAAAPMSSTRCSATVPSTKHPPRGRSLPEVLPGQLVGFMS